MFWHLRMILASKKTLGKFTKVLGFEKTHPPSLGIIPKKSHFFLLGVSLSQKLTIADEGGLAECWPLLTRGGVGQTNFNKRSLRVPKMWVEPTIDLNWTIYVKQNHITCKLDSNHFTSPLSLELPEPPYLPESPDLIYSPGSPDSTESPKSSYSPESLD